MMQRSALLDGAGVLKAHEFTLFAPAPGETVLTVVDEFILEPNRWQWNGAAWVAYLPPPSNAEIGITELKALDPNTITDLATAKATIKALITALKKVW